MPWQASEHSIWVTATVPWTSPIAGRTTGIAALNWQPPRHGAPLPEGARSAGAPGPPERPPAPGEPTLRLVSVAIWVCDAESAA